MITTPTLSSVSSIDSSLFLFLLLHLSPLLPIYILTYSGLGCCFLPAHGLMFRVCHGEEHAVLHRSIRQ